MAEYAPWNSEKKLTAPQPVLNSPVAFQNTWLVQLLHPPWLACAIKSDRSFLTVTQPDPIWKRSRELFEGFGQQMVGEFVLCPSD
jgi:hypothetical protein